MVVVVVDMNRPFVRPPQQNHHHHHHHHLHSVGYVQGGAPSARSLSGSPGRGLDGWMDGGLAGWIDGTADINHDHQRQFSGEPHILGHHHRHRCHPANQQHAVELPASSRSWPRTSHQFLMWPGRNRIISYTAAACGVCRRAAAVGLSS